MATHENRDLTDREYWRDVLTAGGSTPAPQWTRHPVAGVGRYETRVPDDVVTGLRRSADRLTIPLGSLLLAAHAKVLAALSAQQEITTGYVADDGSPRPCRLSTVPASWRELLHHTDRTVAELRAHQDLPAAGIDTLRHELGLTEPLSETVFDPAGIDGDLTEDTVLRVGFRYRDGRLVLRLRYRTDRLDADGAARVAGYHLTALRLIGADPEAVHARQSLLSDDELHVQLEELAGPVRELPPARAHELFEERVRMHPDVVAAVHAGRQWTYGQLNARANRLARALTARGLSREGVVAVVTERNLDWLAAVLAVFKAGGVYLPVEPRFPAERIAAVLSRAACTLVLTEPGSTTTLDQALESLPGAGRLLIDAAYAEDHADDDLGRHVTPGQLAYIYFTSGSTGEPKGAMCEHAGLLNHLYAKIDDLGLGEGQVVAQTAPQCFDISLWQLLGALLTGGRTLLVEQDAVLDVSRFLDTVADSGVTVLQVVPSYLEALLTELERRPRALPDLRYVSVTGEALKEELAARWFAARPRTGLVNAYGLTETSDDTNHEVMHETPDRVLLGRPVSNVRVYVVDEHLEPVPLGAPGLIAFSGVCVGRGYVNDPERTRAAYRPDPHRAGSRLYVGGDYGRWHPSGKLEFLGRRDAQVKIRGFRIEIGEVENTLLRVPTVRDGAVVVAERPDRSAHLVAFYCAPKPLDTAALADRLGASLPAYMVPAAFHWRESLPLTGNGKIDKKALTALATTLAVGEDAHEPPVTPTEQRLAAAWGHVLGVPLDRVGRHDHFFDRGGTSLSAVRLAIALDRAVSPRDVAAHPVLTDLAALLDHRSERPTTTARTDATEPVMSQPPTTPPFSVISGAQVRLVLEDREQQIVDLVEATYRLHAAGDSVDPPSCFLRFPDRPSSRIVALPASIGGPTPVDGLKWISSFPGNVEAGLPRASAVLILNDHETGHPFACLESSVISATRTAASAALAADRLTRDRQRPTRVGFFGTGLIARYIHTFLTGTGWSFDETGVHDLSAAGAGGFRDHVRRTGAAGRITVHDDPEELVRTSDLVVFATTAGEPHVHDPSWFDHNPVVLHVSLRDLAPEIVLVSANIVDDVDHCLRADTSPHLAEQRTGNRDFVHGTLAGVLAADVVLPTDRPLVFSPFGLGVLDLAVGKYVYDETARAGRLHVVEDFFHDPSRHG